MQTFIAIYVKLEHSHGLDLEGVNEESGSEILYLSIDMTLQGWVWRAQYT